MSLQHVTDVRREVVQARPLAWLQALPPPAKDLPPKRLLILYRLGLAMDGRTGAGFVSHKRLAAEAGAGQSTVIRAVAWAVAEGWIRQTRGRRAGGYGRASDYQLTIPKVSCTDTLGDPGEQVPMCQNGVPKVSRTDTPSPPTTSPPTAVTDLRPVTATPDAPLRSASASREDKKPMRNPKTAPSKDQAPLWPAPVATDAEPVEGVIVDAGPPPRSAQTLVAEWVDHCQMTPPKRTIGQMSREIKTLLDEGIPYEIVRRGLAEWHRNGRCGPSALASFVNQAGNGKPAGAPAPAIVTAANLAARLNRAAL